MMMMMMMMFGSCRLLTLFHKHLLNLPSAETLLRARWWNCFDGSDYGNEQRTLAHKRLTLNASPVMNRVFFGVSDRRVVTALPNEATVIFPRTFPQKWSKRSVSLWSFSLLSNPAKGEESKTSSPVISEQIYEVWRLKTATVTQKLVNFKAKLSLSSSPATLTPRT